MPEYDYTGPWVKGRRIFLFRFSSGITYSGVIFDKKIKGIMTTCDGIFQGCFYMEPCAADNLKQEAHIPGTLDASWKKQ